MNGRSYLFCAVLLRVLTPTGHIMAEPNQAEYFTGEVQIETTADGEILVAVDEAQDWPGPDGLADHLFILQQEEPFQHVSRWLAEARLLFTQDRLTVVSRSDRFALILGVGETSGSQLAESVAGSRPVIVEGFGLSHTFDGLGASIHEVASAAFVAEPESLEKMILEGGPGAKGGLCDSGGPGTSNCTVTGCGGQPSGCSVSCLPTYYACCYCESFGNDRARCKCMQ